MTPSFMGLMATTFPGVRPSISFASRPTAITSPVFLLMATIDGSLTTMPLPFANTNVFAVPKSMARSEDSRLKTERRVYRVLLIMAATRISSSNTRKTTGSGDYLAQVDRLFGAARTQASQATVLEPVVCDGVDRLPISERSRSVPPIGAPGRSWTLPQAAQNAATTNRPEVPRLPSAAPAWWEEDT